jgi:hypothetical protein
MISRNDERGVALVLALFALVVIGALVGSTFLAGMVEHQSGRNTLFATQAREAADGGLSDALTALEPVSLASLSVGAPPLSLEPYILEPGLSVEREIVRLTSSLYLLRARGIRRAEDGIILAARSLGLLIEAAPGASPADSNLPNNLGLRVAERGWIRLD